MSSFSITDDATSAQRPWHRQRLLIFGRPTAYWDRWRHRRGRTGRDGDASDVAAAFVLRQGPRHHHL